MKRARTVRATAWTAGLVALGLVTACAGDGDASSGDTPAAEIGTPATALPPDTVLPPDTAPGTTPTTTAGSVAGPSPDPSTSTATGGSPSEIFPGEEWGTVDPAAAGLDAGALGRLADQADAAGSSCLVVTRDGQLVFERTFDGEPDEAHEVYSVTKSVTSLLVGIAQDEGLLSVSDRAAAYITPWQGTPSQDVTVRNLLSNDSGRHWDFGTDYVQMALGASDKTAFAVGLGQDGPPGTVWAYNNSAIQTIEAVLDTALDDDPVTFAQERLLDRIGMDDSTMTTDKADNMLTFMGLQSTCRDLARFGLLAMRDGRWAGEQVVSEAYVDDATGHSSTPLNAAYGYLWWLNRTGSLATADSTTSAEQAALRPPSQLVPGAPEDAFYAIGLGSQIVAVLPSQGIVAVRLGGKPPASNPFGAVELTSGLLDALAEVG